MNILEYLYDETQGEECVGESAKAGWPTRTYWDHQSSVGEKQRILPKDDKYVVNSFTLDYILSVFFLVFHIKDTMVDFKWSVKWTEVAR